MNRTITTMILAAMTATGCASDPMIDEEAPPLETLEGTTGVPGSNGLLVTTFQAESSALRELMNQGIYTDATKQNLNPNVIAFLDDSSGKRKVFTYAIRCALPTSDTITRSLRVYKGGGILTTTTQWTVAGLNTAAKEDLFACIVAHLNPLGELVPIFLSGPSVRPETLSTGYPVREALFTAELTEVGVSYHVWPLFAVPEMCAANPFDALKERVCGQDALECSLVPHQSTGSDCTLTTPGDDGRAICLGRKAIMTRLQNADFLSTLYPECFPEAG